MRGLARRNPGSRELHQALQEVVRSLIPFLRDRPKNAEGTILEQMTEPDRIIICRVCWLDDDDNIRTKSAYRVQFNNAIGPYSDGLRFHRNETLRGLKFLGFDQTFKRSAVSTATRATAV